MKLIIKISVFCFVLFLTTKGYTQTAVIDSMKKVLAISGYDTNRIKTIYRISDAYDGVNTDSVTAYIKMGLTQAQQLKWKKGIAAFYNSLGNLNNDNSNFATAIYYYKAASFINQSIGNQSNLASNLINIGSVYQRKGEASKSLTYTFQGLKIAEKILAYSRTATGYDIAANVYSDQKNYQKAITYAYKSLQNYRLARDKNGEANSIKIIGNIYFKQRNLKEAGNYYNRALLIFKSTGNKLGQATILSQLGLFYENDKDKKLEYLLSAQKLFDEINPKHVVAIANTGNIGGTYESIFSNNGIDKNKAYKNIPKDYATVAQMAKQYLGKAIAYSKESGDNDNLSYFTDNLAQLQEKMGDYRSALRNYKKSRSINDSLYSQESKNKIAAMEAQYTFQKKEDVYKQEQQISKFKMNQIFLFAALFVLLMSTVMVLLLYRVRISQLHLKNELQKKEAEEQTRELIHKSKLSESELKAIRAQMNPHFIFNVLNSIESYILENDSKTASRLVQKFAALSRLILENSTQSLVTADREWKALKLYTELEAMRFHHQFTYSFQADPLLDLSVLLLPPMLVQPLIENSIHHGLRNSQQMGNAVNIKLEQNNTQVFFTVEDNGIGINETEKFKSYSAIKSKSIGLSAIRERIEIINSINGGNYASFNIRKKNKGEGTGTLAILTLPKTFREAAV